MRAAPRGSPAVTALHFACRTCGFTHLGAARRHTSTFSGAGARSPWPPSPPPRDDPPAQPAGRNPSEVDQARRARGRRRDTWRAAPPPPAAVAPPGTCGATPAASLAHPSHQRGQRRRSRPAPAPRRTHLGSRHPARWWPRIAPQFTCVGSPRAKRRGLATRVQGLRRAGRSVGTGPRAEARGGGGGGGGARYRYAPPAGIAGAISFETARGAAQHPCPRSAT
jgi:hypothetical protein